MKRKKSTISRLWFIAAAGAALAVIVVVGLPVCGCFSERRDAAVHETPRAGDEDRTGRPTPAVSTDDALVAYPLVLPKPQFEGTPVRIQGIPNLEPPRPRSPVLTPRPAAPRPPAWNREAYAHIAENRFRSVADHPRSTFSVDVDTASYANVRRILGEGRLPPHGAVRVEEMINYFTYAYPAPDPAGDHPFSVSLAATECPWRPGHNLVRIGIRGRDIDRGTRPAGNLVFLLDVSGSMNRQRKLPLLKRAMMMLVDRLRPVDRVAIVVYAGAAGLILDSTAGDRSDAIRAALARLRAGGSTNGGQGIRLAYDVAAAHFIAGGVNRVILCTDGDFNVGTTSEDELVRLIGEKAETGVFLTVLGFGRGNCQDARMEKLADTGNGHYGYVDTIGEARKILVEQLAGTLYTIAKDVKVQVEFNPAAVAAYRLVGYENRLLAKEEFNDDTADAGEIGAGHTVTALYETIPPGAGGARPAVDPLKYQREPGISPAAMGGDMLTVALRYKRPDAASSTRLAYVLDNRSMPLAHCDADFRFAAAVAAFGMILRESEHVGDYPIDAVLDTARAARGRDPRGYRAGFVRLVETARDLVAARAEKRKRIARHAARPPSPSDGNARFRRGPRGRIYLPAGAVNLAAGRPVTASDSLPIIGALNMITDGDKHWGDRSVVEIAPGVQWVQIDLGRPCRIYCVILWHYLKQHRAYKDVVVMVSHDADMGRGTRIVFNNDHDNSAGFGPGRDYCWVESHEGKVIDAKGATGRYVRFYSNGNSCNDLNHYVEVEICGEPLDAAPGKQGTP